MTSSIDRRVTDEVADVRMGRPHVVILGAGASRAACPKGDKNGKLLPLMADFARCIGIEKLLRDWDVDPDTNFEDLYSSLFDSKEACKLEQLESAVETYFEALELPEDPTLYDHLVLSLREQDIIATFNWDPLLIRAVLRNSKHWNPPRLSFLHGNILAGHCTTDRVSGVFGNCCSRCGNPLQRGRLLYPVQSKNYARDEAIASQWDLLKWGLENAFMVTLFGYSGPKTDKEAIDTMHAAWGQWYARNMEQIEFITLQTDHEITAGWDGFIHTHHYDVHSDFYASWIANHPRRTGEAYLSQYLDAQFIPDNPIPRTLAFPDLWDWYEQFRLAEDTAKIRERPTITK